jgi:hypothetical protein
MITVQVVTPASSHASREYPRLMCSAMAVWGRHILSIRKHSRGAPVGAIMLRLFLPHVVTVTQRHEHAMARTQCDQCIWLDRMPRHQAELIGLSHHG